MTERPADDPNAASPAGMAAVSVPPPRVQRWMRIALVLSLILNLLFLGIVAGAALRVMRLGGPPVVGDVAFGPFSEALAPEDRRALREAYLQSRPDLRELRRDTRADMQQMAAILRAEPWDPAAAALVMAQRADRTMERLSLGQSLLLGRLEAMTRDQRHALADRIDAILKRSRDRSGHDRGGHDRGGSGG